MRKKVIIDCDPGIDDSMAIMLAIQSEELEILGITIVSGNAPVEMGFENAKKVLKQMNRLDIPVFTGARRPLVKAYVDALDTHGIDGLGESFLESVDGYHQNQSAVEFLSDTLRKQPCTVIAIGPMTNLANLIEYDKQAFLQIEQLISMGGAFKEQGNCSPVAEYNYWEDPEAAALVYHTMAEHHKKIHMVDLDVTRQIILKPEMLDEMEQINPEQGSFLRKITKYYFQFHWEWEHLRGCVINDPLAVAYCIDPSLCSGMEAFVDIETQNLSRGQSIVDAYGYYRKPANAVVLTKVDTERFFTFFIDRVLRKKEVA